MIRWAGQFRKEEKEMEKTKQITADVIRAWATKKDRDITNPADQTGLAVQLSVQMDLYHSVRKVKEEIGKFACESQPFFINLADPNVARLLAIRIVDNVPEFERLSDETDLSALAACNPDPVMALARG